MLKQEKGFTLIELLVVIAIIGILAVLILANLNSTRQKARDGRRKSNLRELQTALELYYTDNESYPDTITSGDLGSGYIAAVPTDPLSGDPYGYSTADLSGSHQAYRLTADAENQNDGEAKGTAPNKQFVKCGGDYPNATPTLTDC